MLEKCLKKERQKFEEYGMNYIQASSEHLETIYRLTQDTIRSIYPSYYPKEVVDFFCSHHSREAIQSDIENKNVWILFGSLSTVVGR